MPEVVTQIPFVWERRADEMMRGQREQEIGVKYHQGIGLRLRAHQEDYGKLFEREVAQSRFYGSLVATVADGFTQEYIHRQYDYPDLNYVDGAAAETVRMWERRVGAGSSWAQSLTADAAAFPGPEPAENNLPIDRVFVTSEPHYPDVPLIVMAIVPKSPARGGPWGTIYFTGPCTVNDAGSGTGSYALKMFDSGMCRLYERCRTGSGGTGRAWVRRMEFQYAVDPGPNRFYMLSIASDASEDCVDGSWLGRTIKFASAGAEGSEGSGYAGAAGILQATSALAQMVLTRQAFVYRCAGAHLAQPEPEPLRLDFRRDVRGHFAVTAMSYDPEAIFFDDDVALHTWPTPGTPITVAWYGSFPEGTRCRVRLFDVATELELPGGKLIADTCQSGAIQYPMIGYPFDRRIFRPQIELYADDDTRTPTLVRYRILRKGLIENPDFPTLTFPAARGNYPALGRQELVNLLEVEDATDDPSQESATVEIADFTGEMPELAFRVGSPVDIEIVDTAEPPNVVTKLARFFVADVSHEQIAGERHSDQTRQYPKAGSRLYRVSGPGEATRLKRTLFPARWALIDEPAEGEAAVTPMKVTDALFTSISLAYQEDRIDVPDLPVRFFPDGTEHGGLLVEPYSEVFQFVVEHARDYLGGWLHFDTCAGPSGMWRILQQRRPPYNVLMRFTDRHPGDGHLPHMLGSYPVDTVTGGPYDGQLIPHNFIDRTEGRRTEPAEGNCVLTMGGMPEGNAQSISMLTQFVFNPVSANFFNLGPSHPHYPDSQSPDFLGGDAVPIVVIDATLTTPEAVNWITRRVFDYACFGREYRTFHAPLRYIVDVTDPLQAFPRKLRFGDVVEVLEPDGVTWRTWLVVRCSPSYERDGYQFARYELVTSSRIDSFGMPVGQFDLFALERLRRKAARRAVGRNYRAQFLRTANRTVEVGASPYMALPAWTMPPIQNIDPGDPGFGSFFFMPDYDPAP